MSLIHHEKTQITLDTETGLMWQDNEEARDLTLDYQEAKEYCKNLRLGGFSDWKIPNFDSLLDIYKERNELKNFNDYKYWSSTLDRDHKCRKAVLWNKLYSSHEKCSICIRCVRKEPIFYKTLNKLFTPYKKISENSVALSSLKNKLYFLKYNNDEYFGFPYEILEKINFPKIENSTDISEIITKRLEQKIKEYLRVDEIKEPKFCLIDKDSFIKDEFETQTEFDERVNLFIQNQKKEYELLQTEYNKRVENLGDIKKDFLFETFAQTMGIPLLKDAFYDAETNDMYMTLFMTNYFWEKRIKVEIPNRAIAKDFKTKLNEVKIDATFDFENEEFIFDKVELEFDNNKFTAEESKEQEKQEEIKIDFKLVPEETGLETSKDTQLPKYALEVKTLDNQKLEDEIKILKEKLKISEDNNQNNEILNQEIEDLKESKLSLENILRTKENEIISLKNVNEKSIEYNKVLNKEKENLKQELVSKNSEIEELKKSNLRIHEKSIKDNQVLNNQLINKNYEIEELKKYCNELQLNSFKQEQQTLSKVVERESFSDF